jgi:RAD51-like protein 2
MRRAISTFPHLSQNQINSLANAGYTMASDIRKVQPARLALDLKITNQDAMKILEQCRPTHANQKPTTTTTTSSSSSSGSITNITNTSTKTDTTATSKAKGKSANALEMLKQVRKRPGIITFSPEIDKQLFSGSGGVPIGQMTEFCGAPGLGKTQICMQLACNVTIPKQYGGVEGECIYIDTEGSFMVDRVHQIATALECHLRKNSGSGRGHVPRVSDVLSKIYCFRVHDVTEQLATLKILPEFILAHPNVKLIVLDSVAFHFRHDFTDMAKRSRALSQLAQDLNKMASDYQLSVVVTNHVTTRMGGSGGGGGGGSSSSSSSSSSSNNGNAAYLAPALGESWSHAATNRVELFWNQTQRTARLTKSPSLSLRSVPYQIVAAGVRGIKYRSSGGGGGGGGGGGSGSMAQNKKQRVM